MSHETTLELLLSLRVDQAHGPPATYKPLLVLLALSRWCRYGHIVFSYRETCEPLRELMKRFRSVGESPVTPAMPFWRLRSNGVWEVKTPRGKEIEHRHNRGPTHTELLEQNAQGCFTKRVASDLHSNPSLVFESMGRLLGIFEPAQQSSVMKQLGLWPETPSETKIRQANGKERRSSKERS